jgi:hypothetical protein
MKSIFVCVSILFTTDILFSYDSNTHAFVLKKDKILQEEIKLF